MIQRFIIKENNSRLLLFFAGWGADEQPFKRHTLYRKDFMIVYDYSSLVFDYSLISQYKEIEIVAWSMGVWAVSSLIQKDTLTVIKSTAVNGTPFPIDDEKGIPKAIFEGTLQGLNEITLYKFQRRMCGDRETLNNYLSKLPKRNLEDLRKELSHIQQQAKDAATYWQWDEAYIGTADKIFPPENQLKAWKETKTFLLPSAHYCEELWKKIFI